MTGLRRFLPRYTLRTLAIFLLLATCAEALWCHWEAWYETHRLGPIGNADVVWIDFLDDGRSLQTVHRVRKMPEGDIDTLYEIRVFDVLSGEALSYLAQPEAPEQRPRTSPDGERAVAARLSATADLAKPETRTVIVKDTATNEELAVLAILSTADGFGLPATAFSPDGWHVAVATDNGQVCLFRRRRPEQWWGVFYLGEFWATLIFAAFFAWSIRGDRRYFKALDSRLAASLAAKAAAKAQTIAHSDRDK